MFVGQSVEDAERDVLDNPVSAPSEHLALASQHEQLDASGLPVKVDDVKATRGELGDDLKVFYSAHRQEAALALDGPVPQLQENSEADSSNSLCRHLAAPPSDSAPSRQCKKSKARHYETACLPGTFDLRSSAGSISSSTEMVTPQSGELHSETESSISNGSSGDLSQDEFGEHEERQPSRPREALGRRFNQAPRARRYSESRKGKNFKKRFNTDPPRLESVPETDPVDTSIERELRARIESLQSRSKRSTGHKGAAASVELGTAQQEQQCQASASASSDIVDEGSRHAPRPSSGFDVEAACEALKATGPKRNSHRHRDRDQEQTRRAKYMSAPSRLETASEECPGEAKLQVMPEQPDGACLPSRPRMPGESSTYGRIRAAIATMRARVAGVVSQSRESPRPRPRTVEHLQNLVAQDLIDNFIDSKQG